MQGRGHETSSAFQIFIPLEHETQRVTEHTTAGIRTHTHTPNKFPKQMQTGVSVVMLMMENLTLHRGTSFSLNARVG